MNLSDYQKEYKTFSTRLSNVARTLSFAGIALIWIFRIDTRQGYQLPEILIWPAGFFALSLTLDFFQYAYQSAAWGIFCRVTERKLDNVQDDPPIEASRKMNWFALIFFWGKALAAGTGYILLLIYISSKLFFAN